MIANIKVSFDKKSVKTRIQGAAKKALFLTAEQALKDANQYAPKDQGDLIRSSETHSQPEEGLLIWSTPYARYQYYGVVMVGTPPKTPTNIPLKYTRSGARKLWAHEARARHGDEWQEVFQKVINNNV